MENGEDTGISKDIGADINEYEKNNWKPLLRQCLITSGVCCVYFLQGLFLGAPTVFIAQIRRNANSTEIITDEMLSWLSNLGEAWATDCLKYHRCASDTTVFRCTVTVCFLFNDSTFSFPAATPVISSVPFVVILPLLLNRVGRKRTFIFVWLTETIGFVILYNSTNLYQILISEVFAGPTFASTMTIFPVIVAEYTSPKYRGIFLNLKGATAFWGIWVSNAIGTFFYWKNISIVAFVCSLHVISVVAWPESPYWLAKRGRYAESAKSHRWLKGINENSEKELSKLIVSQKSFNIAKLPSANIVNDFRNDSRPWKIWSIIASRPFYKPVTISVILLVQFYLTGKFVISMYAIEVLKHLTSDPSFVYKEMLILDGVTVFSMYLGCIVSRYCNRRTLLLIFSSTGILVLYILSLYLYLSSLSVIFENDVIILLLLTVFSIGIGCGPMIMCTSIYGEITPPRYQNLAMIFVGSGGVLTMSILLKVSPFLFRSFKMPGTFLFFAVSSSILLTVIYFYLPETKNKTIQEIEQYFVERQELVEHDKTTGRKVEELNNLMS